MPEPTVQENKSSEIWGFTQQTVKLFRVGIYFQWLRQSEEKTPWEPVSPLFRTLEAARLYPNHYQGFWLTDEEWKENYPLPENSPFIETLNLNP